MKVNDLFPSNWLKKEDVPFPVAATIRTVTQEQIKGERGNELKAVLHFVGSLKPMILNKGNASILVAMYGDDTSNWQGKPVEVYADPSVMFAGKAVGGIRLRQPQGRQHNGAAVMTYQQAQAECERAGIPKEVLNAALKANGITNTNNPAFTPFVRKFISDTVAADQGGAMDGPEFETAGADDGMIPF